MEFHPISYTKAHPVGVIACILIGMGLSKYGVTGMIPGFRGGAKVSVDED
jgi:hypothetical protein